LRVSDLRRLGADIRLSILEQSKRANVGHIGSCLSIADLLAALYGDVLSLPSLEDPDRDRFVLSKGHAVLALYAALHRTGRLSEERLESYCEDGSPVAGHPEHVLEGVEFSTGSLGHGLSLAAGSALATRLSGRSNRTFVLVSDAECNEGSLWEAVMFSAHHRLSGLVALVDANGQQALGYTADVLDLSPLAERWAAFGWDVRVVDGHDPESVAAEIASLDTGEGPPHVLIARTTFGKGVSYMESRIHWHYWTMSDDQYVDAVREVSADVEPLVVAAGVSATAGPPG
jgi:transketolase